VGTLTRVYLLWTSPYDEYEGAPGLCGIFDTLELAQGAIPGAAWEFDGERMRAKNPLYDNDWESASYYLPYIEEWALRTELVVNVEQPFGPEFGPPRPPRCPYRDEVNRLVCTLFAYHDGPHDLVHGSWTNSISILTADAFRVVS
jgi:hypothetical protein